MDTVVVNGPITPIAVVENPVTVVTVLRGPRGLDGAGSTRFFYAPPTPANTWIVNHNFGYYPTVVTIRSPGGVEVEADVHNIDTNQLIIYFSTAYMGSVEVL